ncbi:AMP-binding protein, partial [Candidatus Gottesmanbacteria bacterium]|nr:AMP-binding protein [Candidatus Gottesmanbacteria bacterium]
MKSSTPNDQYRVIDLPRIPIPDDSVAHLLASHARKFSQKIAIVAVNVDTDEADTISYGQLDVLVRRAASWLSSLGIIRGDRFAILMHNAPEVLILELAGAMIGAATVPLDFKRDTLDRKIYKLKDTGAKMLFIKNEDISPDDSRTIIDAKPDITIRTWSSTKEFERLLPTNSIVKATGALDDYYVVLYTSGTTALPKGVLLSTRACLLNAMGIVDWQKFTVDDVFNIVLPLHHINSTEF